MRALHLDPRCSKALINIGYAYQQESFPKRVSKLIIRTYLIHEAWSIFSQMIAVDPICHEAYEGRAHIHLEMKNTFGALMDISKAIVYFPELTDNLGTGSYKCRVHYQSWSYLSGAR